MANSNNKSSSKLISNAFGVAKKFSTVGLELLDHVAPNSVAKINSTQNQHNVVEGGAKPKHPFQGKKYDSPQQMFKEHLPNVSRQMLGRHFNTVNNVAHLVSPELSDKVSDYFFEQINHFSNQLSGVDLILDEVGAKELEELTQDVERSKRISNALAEQNKWFAAIQGALSGATGVVGSAVDIPASLIMALRMIYQVGRSYGFELEKSDEQDVVQYIFKQVDLGLIAEKQAVLLAIKTLSSTLKNHDVQQLQGLLGSDNNMDALKGLLLNTEGKFKWDWLNQVPKISVFERIAHLSPVAGAGVGAVYSWRLLEDVNQKAQHVFATSRHYLQSHQKEELSLMAAYEKAVSLLAQATPKLLQNGVAIEGEATNIRFDEDIQLPENKNISHVKLVAREQPDERTAQVQDQASKDLKKEELKVPEEDEVNPTVQFDDKIQTGFEALKTEMLTPASDEAVVEKSKK